jgi:hypothetical protein
MTTERKPHGYYTDKVFTPADVDKAIAAERKVLVAQRTEQEPVQEPWKPTDADYKEWWDRHGLHGPTAREAFYDAASLYLDATPPQRTEPLIGCVNHDCAKCKERTWVGLTEDEMFELWLSADEQKDRMAFGKAVETKLKEKNA